MKLSEKLNEAGLTHGVAWVDAARELEAQVSQLTAALKETCDELDAWQRSREMDGGRVSNAEKEKLARCRAAIEKWGTP